MSKRRSSRQRSTLGEYDLRKVGDRVWFEYHCFESDESSDADIWHRSHQKVEIVDGPIWDGKSISALEVSRRLGVTRVERGENATCVGYEIRFDDGFEKYAFEDELLDRRDEFERPDPPPENQ